MQEKLQDRSPGESENKFIKAWDSGAKEELPETESGGRPGQTAPALCSPESKSDGDPESLAQKKHSTHLRNVGRGQAQRRVKAGFLCPRGFI